MSEENAIDRMIYGAIKIINIINIVLLFGVIFAFLEINKYIAFTILFIFAAVIVFISRKLLDEFLNKNSIVLEGTLVFKALAIATFCFSFIYFSFKGEWVLLLLYILLIVCYQSFLMYVRGKNLL